MQVLVLALVWASAVSATQWSLRDPLPLGAPTAVWTDPQIWCDADTCATGVPADGDDVIIQGAAFVLTVDVGVSPNLNSLQWNAPMSGSVYGITGASNNQITVGAGGLTIKSDGPQTGTEGFAFMQSLQITVTGGPVKINGPVTLFGATIAANSGGISPDPTVSSPTPLTTTLLLDSTAVLRFSGGFALNAGTNISRTATGAAVEFGDCTVASAVVLDDGLVLRGPLYVPNGQLTFAAPRTIGALNAWAGTLRVSGGVLTIGTATVTNTGGNTASIASTASGTMSIGSLFVTSGSSLLGPNEVLSVTTALGSVPATATAAIYLPGMTVAVGAMSMSACAVMCDFTGIVDFGSQPFLDIPAGGAMAINSARTLAGSLIPNSVVDSFLLNANSRVLVNGPIDVDQFDFDASATASATLGNGARIAISSPTFTGSGALIFANATVHALTWSTNVQYSIPVGGLLYMAVPSTLPNIQSWAGRWTVRPTGNPIAGVASAPAGVITSTASFGPSDSSGQLGLQLTDGVLPAGFTFFGSPAPDMYLTGTCVVPQAATAGVHTVYFNANAHVAVALSYGAQADGWDADVNVEVQFTAPAGQSGPFPLPSNSYFAAPGKLSSANGNVLYLNDSTVSTSRALYIGRGGSATSAITLDAIAISVSVNPLEIYAAADMIGEIILSNGAFITAAAGLSIQAESTPADTRIAFRTGANAQHRNTGMRLGSPGIAFGAAFGEVNASTCLYTTASASDISSLTSAMRITPPSDCATNALFAGCNGNACGTHSTACAPSATYANCTCAAGWRGQLCGINIACEAVPCANGGTCVPAATGTAHTCECPTTFTGTSCAEPVAASSTAGATSSTGGSSGVDRAAVATAWPVSVLLCAIGLMAARCD